jgi:CheY-like chemotaxis protein
LLFLVALLGAGWAVLGVAGSPGCLPGAGGRRPMAYAEKYRSVQGSVEVPVRAHDANELPPAGSLPWQWLHDLPIALEWRRVDGQLWRNRRFAEVSARLTEPWPPSRLLAKLWQGTPLEVQLASHDGLLWRAVGQPLGTGERTEAAAWIVLVELGQGREQWFQLSHEVNNLVTALLGQLHVLGEALPPSDPRQAALERLSAMGHRVAQLGGLVRGPSEEMWQRSRSGPGPARPGVVLLAEDEPAVREVLARSLRLRGHQVLEARHGREALRLLDEAAVEVLVTDLDMPIVDGDALAREAKTRDPSLAVVFITGHAGARPLPLAGRLPLVLRKPFRPEVLARLIEQLLLERRRPQGLPATPP